MSERVPAMETTEKKFQFPVFYTKKSRVEFFKKMLSENTGWAIRALEVIYKFQTLDEKAAGVTAEDNGVGFTGVDAELLSSFAVQIAKNKAAKSAGTLKQGFGLLSPKQSGLLLKKMGKYAVQLITVLESEGKAPPVTPLSKLEQEIIDGKPLVKKAS